MAGSWSNFSADFGPERSGIGLAPCTEFISCEESTEVVTSAVPGAPETPGNAKSGLLRPSRWQLSQDSPARAPCPPSSSGVRNAARPSSTR